MRCGRWDDAGVLALVQPRELISAAVLPQDGHSPFATVRVAKALPFFILYLTMRLSFRGPSSFSSAFRPVGPFAEQSDSHRRTPEQSMVVTDIRHGSGTVCERASGLSARVPHGLGAAWVPVGVRLLGNRRHPGARMRLATRLSSCRLVAGCRVEMPAWPVDSVDVMVQSSGH